MDTAKTGLTADGVVGTDTVQALSRISGRISGDRTVAAVRELERLRDFDDEPAARRIVVGESGGVPAVVDAVARRPAGDSLPGVGAVG